MNSNLKCMGKGASGERCGHVNKAITTVNKMYNMPSSPRERNPKGPEGQRTRGKTSWAYYHAGRGWGVDGEREHQAARQAALRAPCPEAGTGRDSLEQKPGA